MASPEFNRRLFAWVLWIFAGLALLILLTSCNLLDPYGALYAPPAVSTVTASPGHAPAVSTETAPPHPTYIVIPDALEVRSGPSETARNIGYLTRGDIVTIYATAQAEHEYCPAWAKIDPARERWVCFSNLTTGE